MSGIQDRFPVPVDGQEIPKGWFARLVVFLNSLVLRGDGKYFAVRRSLDGTSIAPSAAMLELLGRSGGAPGPAGGGATGIESDVSGGSASITLSGGTGSVVLAPGSNMSIASGQNGEIVFSATGGASAFHAPDLSNIALAGVDLEFNHVYTFNAPVWLVGTSHAFEHIDSYGDPSLVGVLDLYLGSIQEYLLYYIRTLPASGMGEQYSSYVCRPIPANTQIHFDSEYSNDHGAEDMLRDLNFYYST